MKDTRTKYEDTYGNVWIRFKNSDLKVWNKKSGWGLWNNGRGLTQKLKKQAIDL